MESMIRMGSMTKRMAALALPVCAAVLGMGLSACASTPTDTQAQRIFDAALIILQDPKGLSDVGATSKALDLSFRAEEIRVPGRSYCGTPGVTSDSVAVRHEIVGGSGRIDLVSSPTFVSNEEIDRNRPSLDYVIHYDRVCTPNGATASITLARLFVHSVSSRGCVSASWIHRNVEGVSDPDILDLYPSLWVRKRDNGNDLSLSIGMLGNNLPLDQRCAGTVSITQRFGDDR